MPIWIYGLTVGRVLSKKQDADDTEDDDNEIIAADSDSSSGAGGKHTPSTGSVDDDFELLDKSVEDVSATAKTTGSQPQGSKSGKRKGKGKKK